MSCSAPQQTPVVRGRFAPSPSGKMHLGNAFAYLLAWLSAKAEGGSMLLRIEDLDERSHKKELADQLMYDLEWLGLYWDEGPFYQSKRNEVYEAYKDKLIKQDLVYPCFCTRAELHAASAPHASDGSVIYPGTCKELTKEECARRSLKRTPALRLRVPEASDLRGTYRFSDLCCGEQTDVLAHVCGDFLIQRSDAVFAYQFAVIVDDALMGITQVVRGNDLLSSVSRQLYIADCLKLSHPSYAHIPLLTAPDGRRLSKRDRDLDIKTLRERGVSAQKIIGWLALQAGLTTNREELLPQDLINQFLWERIAKLPKTIAVDAPF